MATNRGQRLGVERGQRLPIDMAQDKRQREGVVGRVEEVVARAGRRLRIAAFGGVARVTRERQVVEAVLTAPRGTPLAACLARPDIREPLELALRETQALLADPAFVLEEEVEEEERGEVHRVGEEVAGRLPQRPPRPVLEMDTKQMMSYFPRLLRDLYRLEGHTSPGSYRLYPKLDPQGKVVEPATPLGIWDGVVEAILPRTVYLGGGKRFPGPLLDRQRRAAAHLLTRLGLDPSTYSQLHKEQLVKEEVAGEVEEMVEERVEETVEERVEERVEEEEMRTRREEKVEEESLGERKGEKETWEEKETREEMEEIMMMEEMETLTENTSIAQINGPVDCQEEVANKETNEGLDKETVRNTDVGKTANINERRKEKNKRKISVRYSSSSSDASSSSDEEIFKSRKRRRQREHKSKSKKKREKEFEKHFIKLMQKFMMK